MKRSRLNKFGGQFTGVILRDENIQANNSWVLNLKAINFYGIYGLFVWI